jgi:integrase
VRRGDGRTHDSPPTPAEFDRLLDAFAALGDYADQMRALLWVGADTGTRPGELFALEWADIDLASHRIHVRRRLYRGELDLPKSNRTRTIALPPPARDVLLRQPTRHLDIVSASKTGRRLSQPTLAGFWAQVRATAGLEFDFYMVTLRPTQSRRNRRRIPRLDGSCASRPHHTKPEIVSRSAAVAPDEGERRGRRLRPWRAR